MVGVAVLVFLLIRLIPGSVVDQILGAQFNRTEGQVEALRRYFGLDQPLYRQFWTWISAIAQGDLGTSWRTGVPVRELIASRLPVTLELAGLGLLIAMLLGIPGGLLAAVRRGGWADSVVRGFALIGLSVPEFWLGTLFVMLCSRWLDWTPSARYIPFRDDPIENLLAMSVPAFTLGLVLAANIARMTRAAMLDVLKRDYMRTARAKGLGEQQVMVGHAFRSVLIPVVTIVGLQAGYLIGGAVVIEQVFTLPGMGRLVVGAIEQRDYPLVQGVILVSALGFVLINLFVDWLYVVLDPRARHG
ncbi:MAG: ABC transporter permease [Thermomicrobiales bacterium]|nr:ABC transporter permease [Thermomicrobiales bacterium]